MNGDLAHGSHAVRATVGEKAATTKRVGTIVQICDPKRDTGHFPQNSGHFLPKRIPDLECASPDEE